MACLYTVHRKRAETERNGSTASECSFTFNEFRQRLAFIIKPAAASPRIQRNILANESYSLSPFTALLFPLFSSFREGQVSRSHAASVCPLVIPSQFLTSYTIFFASHMPSAAIRFAYPTPPLRTRSEVGAFFVFIISLHSYSS
jgi:hypothetical protein